MAAVSRFCEVWIRNTISRVATLLLVLITNCQVSLKWNNGPVSAQTAT